MKNKPESRHFTVAIPTRERSDTLEQALRTCVDQDHDDLEILVSDNFSQDRTREVVESFGDPRIRYINTGKRLSMSGNFEFALSNVPRKGYVIVIGDDDGLLPNAIREMDAVIDATGTQVLRWDVPTYWWPSADGNRANRLLIPSLRPGIEIRDSAATIESILSFKGRFPSLPMLYLNSAVEFGVMERIKASSGKFYHSMTPDVYSGFAIAGTVPNFANSRRPFTIGGTSHHSSGQSALGPSLTGPAREFMIEDNLPIHSSLSFCFSIDQIVIECFLQARDHVPMSREFTVDMEKLVSLMMKDASRKSQEIYSLAEGAVSRIGQTHGIVGAAQRAIAANPIRKSGSDRKRTFAALGRAGSHLAGVLVDHLRKGSVYLDCSGLNVRNIHDASLLCDHLFKLKDIDVLGYSLVVRSALANVGRHLSVRNA